MAAIAPETAAPLSTEPVLTETTIAPSVEPSTTATEQPAAAAAEVTSSELETPAQAPSTSADEPVKRSRSPFADMKNKLFHKVSSTGFLLFPLVLRPPLPFARRRDALLWGRRAKGESAAKEYFPAGLSAWVCR